MDGVIYLKGTTDQEDERLLDFGLLLSAPAPTDYTQRLFNYLAMIVCRLAGCLEHWVADALAADELNQEELKTGTSSFTKDFAGFGT